MEIEDTIAAETLRGGRAGRGPDAEAAPPPGEVASSPVRSVDEEAHARIARFWEARAREDARRYSIPGAPAVDPDRFLASAEPLLAAARELVGWDPSGAELALDVGCGAGRLTGALAARSATTVACDVAPTMLRVAREHHAAAGNVDWHEAVADDLGFVGAGTVDVALLLGVLPHLPTAALLAATLQEVGRVLRPDATVLFDVRATPPPLRLPGEEPAPEHVVRHPLWRGTTVDLETLDATALTAGLLIERIEGSGGERCLVLARRDG